MSRSIKILALILFAMGSSMTAQDFEVQKLADGVYAAVKTGPAGLFFDPNNVFIVSDEDVIVVDSNFSHATTREVLAAIRKVTNKPVRIVINTHWHDDHITGNQVYRQAFPDVEFIGHESAAADMAGVGARNRNGLQNNARGLAKMFRDQIEKKKSLTGRDLTDEEQASYSNDARLVERYVESIPPLEIIAPTRTVKDKLVLKRGGRTIEILHLGRGHTAADLVVHLPREGIVITGDLVVHPVPLVGSTSIPGEYAATLDKLLSLKPRTMVPGHGPVMRDDKHVRQMISLIASIREQTAAAVKRGETMEQARKSVDLEAFRRMFAGDSQNKSFIFKTYVADSGVEAAYREATQKK